MIKMKKILLLFLVSISMFFYGQKKYVVVIHGGAGTILKKEMSPELEQKYRDKLKEALNQYTHTSVLTWLVSTLM
jgi:beta-aspartyl-peptidase (threonine type)